MPLIAVTGGIAAGKSTVCNRLRELGAHVESADELVRFVQRKGSPVLVEIRDRFGLGVIDGSGELDRVALGRLVFEDADARRDLEAIVHPAVQAELASRISVISTTDPNAVIVYDIPLLVESKRMDEFDSVIVLACDPDIRRQRLIDLRGLTADEADARIAAQATEVERMQVADWIIDTGESLEETLEQVDDVWQDIIEAYRA
ncbi:MAG: dephospho-CoA kinase [Microbacteriaceae bacterium]